MVTELRSFKGIVRIPASVRLWVTRWKLEATFGSNKLFLRQQSKFEQIGDAFDFVLTDSFCVAEAWGLCQGSEFFRWPGETNSGPVEIISSLRFDSIPPQTIKS